jgi:hypothetical protein
VVRQARQLRLDDRDGAVVLAIESGEQGAKAMRYASGKEADLRLDFPAADAGA